MRIAASLRIETANVPILVLPRRLRTKKEWPRRSTRNAKGSRLGTGKMRSPWTPVCAKRKPPFRRIQPTHEKRFVSCSIPARPRARRCAVRWQESLSAARPALPDSELQISGRSAYHPTRFGRSTLLGIGMDMKHLILGLLAVFIFLCCAIGAGFYAPRFSVVLFLPLAAPILFLAYFKRWHRMVIWISTAVMLVALSVSPVDLVIKIGESKKGVFYLPVRYGMWWSIESGYYSPGCIVIKNGPKHVLLLSL